MELQGAKKIKLPEWYVFEKETENTISKLSNLKDLVFYLRHQDSAVRRMAILRINELKLKDSVDLLSGLMDDPSESTINKELAAWTIKAVSIKWDVDLYVSSRLLSRYSGNEPLSKLFCVNIVDAESQYSVSFPSFIEKFSLDLKENPMGPSDGIAFETTFSLSEWLVGWSKALPRLYINYFLAVCKSCFSVMRIITIKTKLILDSCYKRLSGIKFRKPKIRQQTKNELKIQPGSSHYRNAYSLTEKSAGSITARYSPAYRQRYSLNQIWQTAGNLLFKFAYIFFAPVRLLIRHRKAAFALLFTVYLLGAYTEPGKYYTYKYLGTDLAETQAQVYYTSREFLDYAWEEFKEIVGLPEHDYNEAANVAPHL